MCKGMKEVSLKDAQKSLQSCITWTKKSGKGCQEWDRACIDAGLPTRKLKTPVKTRFASKVVLFQETQEYADAISICYRRQSLKLQARVPSGMTWAIARTVTQTLNPVVQQCVLNQTRGYWLLSDALAAAFRMSIQLQGVYDQSASVIPPLQVGDFESEIEILKARMAKTAVDVMKPFLRFSLQFVADQAQNMLSLMLDPRFKGLELVIQYVGVAAAKQVVEDYDRKILIPYLVKVHKFLNPGDSPATQLDPAPSSILFGAPASAEEACEGILIAELSLFRRLTIVHPEAEEPLAWWKLNASRFPSVSFLARQILAIPGSQIETERIFSIAGVLTSLRRCRLGLNNLDSLIMINKNWPDDSRHECEVTPVVKDVKEYFAKEMEQVDDFEAEIEEAGYFEEQAEDEE